jgi:hypothetical protein
VQWLLESFREREWERERERKGGRERARSCSQSRVQWLLHKHFILGGKIWLLDDKTFTAENRCEKW